MNCSTGKKPLDYRRAEKRAKRSSAAYDKPMGFYKCWCCGMWHLGSPKKRSRTLPFLLTNHQVRFS